MDKLRFKTILATYRNKERVCGQIDCNLLVLELFEPEMFEQLVGRYTTTRGGARVANKLFGFKSIRDFLTTNKNYEQRTFNEISFGDIIVTGIDVMVCVGTYAFGVSTNHRFEMMKLSNKKNQLIFRRTS
ncbi:TPA: hypothetical protein JG855_002068 [Vibrio parahaemolyticus]|uniref:DUF6950 family protein n=1 Tax=Vibrio TaxID=662 RepID=UPI001303E2BF|nr:MULTISPECIES: hypothetical protein [Vibrio]HAV1497978.1 hypothetical protein [Vibrio parahaemolyticus]MCG6354779.1 hypothetical protein [Vibrio alginolyticus]MCK8112490.1 hypothetical protein [Vibrio sp. 2CM40D]MDW1533284.1 hypothetical protein [Vibrio sp. Y159]HAV1503147.1 hypothetical protein [Vibrio parahaemolyticus]